MSSEYVLDPGSEIKCPHCDEKQEGIVNDYVVTGRPGAYDEQCGGCDSWFTVSLLKDGRYHVVAIEDDDDD
jgi:hypothetical protein